MPRDGGGTYTLPAGNPVIPGTIIETTWANPTMNDIAAALTDSLSRTGSGGMIVPFLNADGTVNLPGISWANQQNMGFYRPGLDEMRVSVAANDKARWTSDALNPMDVFVGGFWVPVMNQGGDYSPTGNWDFSGAASFIPGPMNPIYMRETGATADEGNWILQASGDKFILSTADDASPGVSVEDAFYIERSAAVVDFTQFMDEIRVGNSVSSYLALRHNAAGPSVIDSVNSNQILMLPNNVQATMLKLGNAGAAIVPLGASASQNAGLQIGSTTGGHQAGFLAYVADGARNWATFFGLHDNDVWGLSLNAITSGNPPFVVQSNGELLIDAVRGGAARLYFNAGVKLATELVGVNVTGHYYSRSGGGSLYLHEKAGAAVDIAGLGQYWVRDDQTPMFTTDAGVDIELLPTGAVAAKVVGCKVYNTVAQSIPDNAETVVNFGGEAYDTGGFHSTPNSRITIQANNTRCRFTGQIVWPPNGSSFRRLEVRKNGINNGAIDDDMTTFFTQVYASAANASVPNLGMQFDTGIINADATDYFEVVVYHDAGPALSLVDEQNWFQLEVFTT